MIICIVPEGTGLSRLLHEAVKKQGDSKLHIIKPGHVLEHQNKSQHKTFIFSVRKIRAFYCKMFQGKKHLHFFSFLEMF